ncbi:sensor histidine kinase [Luteimonas sp. e5]
MSRSPLVKLRHWFSPPGEDHGWMPLASLAYLAFLFMPLLMRAFGGRTSDTWQMLPFELGATWLSVALFLPLYLRAWRGRDRIGALCVAGIAVLGFALLPWNAFANTYIIYAAVFLGMWATPLGQRLALLAAMLALFGLAMLGLRWPVAVIVFIVAVTTMVSFAAFFGTHFQVMRERKQAELKLSHDEVRRIAAVAERERIGRDLHDLLGHTLSMIALKAELAGKLATRDAEAARREIDEVAHVARDALAQVRTAVSGIRSAVLAAELASARVLLEAEGVAVSHEIDAIPMSAEIESALALVLREAATNIQRHARARHARIRLRAEGDALRLDIEDDGRGGTPRAGHGIAGMHERIAALGGTLAIEPCAPHGLCVSARVPRQGAG